MQKNQSEKLIGFTKIDDALPSSWLDRRKV
jgi:hypothetical protein